MCIAKIRKDTVDYIKHDLLYELLNCFASVSINGLFGVAAQGIFTSLLVTTNNLMIF